VVVVIMAVVLLLAVLGAEARPLSGGGWAVTAGDEPLPSGGGVFIVETLRRLYLQQLGAGPSCQTNSPNNGCPPP
jgi:hypothetical protein